jgi:sugar/nucleoside kinase (ribokinase family)
VRLVAPFGCSSAQPIVAGALREAGVQWHDPVAQLDHPSPISSVLVTEATGERAVISGGGPPGVDRISLSRNRIDRLLAEVGVVLVDGHVLPVAVPIAAAARDRGIPVLLDAGSHKPGLEALVDHVDLAIASADFRAPDGQNTLDWLLDHGVGYVARSAGPDPVEVRINERVASTGRRRPAYRIVVPHVRVVDTLGAGDVLHGAAAHAVARLGLSPATLPRILRYAVRVAAHSCRYPGVLGWTGDPRGSTWSEVQP